MAERNPSDDQAAFGVFPQLKRNRAKQDREAAKNVPVDLMRGAVSGVLGAPGDIESIVRMLPYLDEKTVLPTSEDIEKRLPFKSDTPVSRAATGLSQLAGGFYNGPLSPLRVIGALPSAVKHGAEEFAKASVAGVPHVIKPSSKANWLGGSNIHVPERDMWRFKTQPIAGETPAQRIPHHEALLNDPTLNLDQLDRVKYQLEQTKGEAALDNWVDTALMGYFKGPLASPQDPVRLFIEKNYTNIEAKFAKDQERAARMAQRAEEELDPRRKGNMKRQAETMMAQARDDRDMAMQNISHLPPEMLRDIQLDPKSYIKEERVKAGYPAEGLGTTEPSKKWEHQADEAIKVTRAGDIQDAMELQPKLDKALQEQYAVHYKMGQKFGDLLREKGLDEATIESLVKSMPRSDKAEAVGMLDELQKVDSNYLRLLDQDRSFPKFAAQDNPQIAGLNPETKMYSGYMGDLGFEHVMDVLRQDVAAGRIRPDQLNKLSVEQAIRRTQEYNLERAKTMRDAKIKQQEGFPLHKEYPEGYKWIELKTPEVATELPSTHVVEPYQSKGDLGQLYRVINPTTGMRGEGYATPERAIKEFNKSHAEEKLADALKYEGDTMGHCVGGYCPDVAEGRSRIFSLRDTKGEPHVTIEVQPKRSENYSLPVESWFESQPQEVKNAINEAGYKGYNVRYSPQYKEALSALPPDIIQIKGKQNAAPKADYLPYVQDFVKSGNWGQVGDMRNTGLRHSDDAIGAEAMQALKEQGVEVPRYVTQQEAIKLSSDAMSKAGKYLPPTEGMKRGGVAISKNPDTMMLELGNKRMANGGAEDDTKPYFGGAGTKKYAAAKKRAEDADVNLLKDPKTYAAVASFMGEAPDELGFSVLHPDYEGVRKVADPAYGLGIAAQVAPIVGPLTKGFPVGASIKNVSPLESSGVFTKAMAKADAERALPLVLPRAMPKSLAEINAHAERVARQMMGEHVTSGKAGDTTNLAGRSMKESQRVKNLDYEIVPTKDVPESQVYQPQIGDINVALPGDFTLSDVELKSLQGEPVGSRQQGGSRYGLGHLNAKIPLFYASNEVPAQGVQNKVDDLYNLFGPERVMGHHMAMGPVATNFAQHFADANLRYTDYSKLRPQDMYQFDKIISEGFVKSKKDKKTGETIRTIVDFPDWPGIADPQAAFAAMESNPEMRKWYNRVMQTPKITSALNLPSGLDVRYAITSPDLRDMEVNLTGHGVGRMKPGATLTDTANHNTYAKGIQGIYEGHQDVLSPFPISFADATQHIITHYSPKDFTGTIQKVFPHQRVDQQYLDELGAYRKRIKELTGKKKGGQVHKAAGGAITGDDLIIEERPL